MVVSVFALWSSRRSTSAAERSAAAAEQSNQYAKAAADAAAASNELTRRTLEDETKRVKGRAYWALYSTHNRLERMRYFEPEGIDLAAIQDLHSIYGHALPEAVREKLRVALNGIDLVINFQGPEARFPEYRTLKEEVRRAVRDAALDIREEWSPPWPDSPGL